MESHACSTKIDSTIRTSSPDFSLLSPEELDQLEIVLQKQVQLENERNQRLSGLRRTMLHLQRNFTSLSSSTQQAQTLLSTSDTFQCCICQTTMEIPSNNIPLSPPILCADCHQPVCRRCGNYTSPELIPIECENHFENQTHTSKWRCRMCIVRREVIRKSGSWNIAESETSIHSPVHLLEKLTSYRASTSESTKTSIPLETQHKSTILSESTNFFSRIWRPSVQQSTTTTASSSSSILIASHQTNSSSFDNIPELNSVNVETSTGQSIIAKTNRRMSFIREVSSKNLPHLHSHTTTTTTMTTLQAQATASSTITDPSFEDTTSEHPCDTTSEFYSQSFETNMDSGNADIIDEQDHEQIFRQQSDLTYNERHRLLEQSAVPVIQYRSKMSSLPTRLIEHNRSDSLPSPEANIDVSLAMNYFSNSMKTEQLIDDSTSNSNDNFVRSNLKNSDSWARKRALLNRGYQWTTTLEGMESSINQENQNLNSTKPICHYLPNRKDKNQGNFNPNILLTRRRSSRRLPDIPSNYLSSTSPNSEKHMLENSILFSALSNDCSSCHTCDTTHANRASRSKSIDSETSLKIRSLPTKLSHTHQSQNAKTVDLSNVLRRKSYLIVNSTLLPQRSLDYPCIVRKSPNLSDIVRRRMLYSKISKQQQSENFSLSLEREHVPKVPRKIIIRQDNSIEIALSKPPKLRRQTLSEDYYYGCNPETDFPALGQATSASSSVGLTVPSSGSGLSAADRRKTIETCENIYLHAEESSKLRARTPPANPHRVLLHRDKGDASIRTNGLGMRIVGGQECEDGSLGCFVTNILSGGPADVQGNIEVGDQILEFNGHSLIDSTYEEVRTLQDSCGDIVQLVVQHNNVRLQINGGQALSAMEISRHFETVPRLATSLTRKRRNLPPLPPSLSSSFPKQQKRELYDTVETLEVPNVKELKPILINRGRLLAQIWHDVDDMKVALTIIQAINLPLRPNGDQPYTFLNGKMLFEDRGFDMFETKIIHSSNPTYNETFVFHDVESVDGLHLEIFIWDRKQSQPNAEYNRTSTDEIDEFLGMIQLPMNEANLEDEPRWYELRDRQTRKPSASSVTFKSSSAESGDSCRKMPPLLPLNRSQEQPKTGKDIMTHPLTISSPSKMDLNRRNSSTSTSPKNENNRISVVPSIVMTSMDDDDDDDEDDDGDDENNSNNKSRRRSSIAVQSDKLKRRISKGILKLFDAPARRLSDLSPKSSPSATSRKLSSQMRSNIDSEDDSNVHLVVTYDSPVNNSNKSPRHSIISTSNQDEHQRTSQQMPIGQLMLPYIPSSRHSSISGSRKSSATSYCDSDDDIDRYFTLCEQQKQHEQCENNVQTHTAGPGQVTPRNYENMINDRIHMGEIQLGLIVTKGLLEIDIICGRRLERVINETSTDDNTPEDIPPDTYVKTYLRTGTRRVQKRKTAIVKGTYSPEYHTKLKYKACNVMGRRLQVTVWQRARKFGKNQCIGEAFIQLDNLTLTQHTIAWYKLFREKLVESEFYDSS